MYKNHLKSGLDIIISTCVLLVLWPVFLITAIAIKLESKGPVIFKQVRLGKDHKTFNMYKFRSMVVNAEHTGSGVYSGKGDSRVTKVGLKGDMSLIGPRPPLTYHPWTIDKYTQEELRMFEMRPGITGWAQVNGRKDVEWHKRIRLNIWYIDHCSFLLDIKIFFMTIFKVLANADNENKGQTVQEQKIGEQGHAS